MSSSDIVTPQNHLSHLEQENERLRCLLKQQNGSPLQACEQACGMSSEHRLLEATAIAANALLTIAPFDTAVNTALQILGESLETDRVAVIENFDHPTETFFKYWRTLYNWRSPYAVDQVAHPEAGQGSYESLSEWYQLLEQGQNISYLIEEAPEPLRSGQMAIGVKATHVVPISVEGQFWGMLGFDDCREAKRRGDSELAVLRVAADCMGSAIQRQRMQQAHEEAERQVLLEREKAAQERAAELAKANTALQRVIDALTAIDDLDEFVPATLRIVAQTFETENCAFYEHSDNALIYLRYWLMGDRVLRPDDLVTLDSESFSMVRRLAAGFTVPDSHLGTPVRDRTRAVILDHTCAMAVPEFHEFACRNGWEMELNVPLVVDGYAEGALVIYRSAGTTYTPSEIGLAEALGKQLALAMQASRLATEKRSQAVETALAKLNEVLAREQEQAAQERVATLERVQLVLQQSTKRLSAATDSRAIIVEILRTAAEVLAPLGVKGIGLMSYQPASRTVRVKAHISNDVEQTIAGSDLDGDWSVDSPAMVIPWQRIQTENFVWGLTSDTSVLIAEVRQYHESLGTRAIAYIPLRREEETTGWIGFNLASELPPTSQQIEMIQALTSQIVLAAEMDRLAEVAREAAIAREQEKAAQERVAELTKANEALKQTVDVLATETDLDRYLGQVLRVIAEQFEAPLTEYWYHPEPANLAYVGLTYWQGQILKPEEQPGHVGSFGYPVPPEMIGQESLHHRRSHVLIEDMATSPLHLQIAKDYGLDAGAWYGSRGVGSLLNVPLLLGDKTIGALIVFFPTSRPFTEQQIELAHALAQQVTLAIQLTRLAEETKQAEVAEAIAREQEKAAQAQAAELAVLNEALRQRDRLLSVVAQVTQDLLEAENVDLAIPAALQAVGKAANMSRVLLFAERRDPLTHRLKHWVEYEWVTTGFSNHASLGLSVLDNEDFQALTQPLHAGQSTWRVIDDLPDVSQSQFEKLHIKSTGAVPIFIEGQYVGCVTFDDCVTPRHWTQQEMDVLTAAADSIGAALHRKQLVDRLVAERLRAEQERAAELAKANEVLRRSLDALVAEQTLPGFLGHVLTSITHQLASPSSVLWLYDREQRTANLSLVFNGQTVKPASQTHHPNAKLPRDYSSPERAHAWEAMIHQRQSELLVIATDTRMTPSQRDYLLGQSIWGILSIPLVLGDRTEGTFAIHFHAPRQFREEELELVQTLANQAALAIQMAQLAEQAKDAALLEERNRLAGEIHDTLAQAFTGISMQLSVAKWLIQQDPIAVDGILDRINDIAQGGLAEARRSVWTLYPVEPAYADLAQKLSRCVKQMTSGTSMRVDVQISGSPCPLSPLVGKNLLRLGQEAITNTLKHAQATVLKIHLTYTEATLCLCLQDNGCGFLTDSDYTGFGLISMSDRADRIGGQLTIHSQPGQGTETTIQVPLP